MPLRGLVTPGCATITPRIYPRHLSLEHFTVATQAPDRLGFVRPATPWCGVCHFVQPESPHQSVPKHRPVMRAVYRLSARTPQTADRTRSVFHPLVSRRGPRGRSVASGASRLPQRCCQRCRVEATPFCQTRDIVPDRRMRDWLTATYARLGFTKHERG